MSCCPLSVLLRGNDMVALICHCGAPCAYESGNCTRCETGVEPPVGQDAPAQAPLSPCYHAGEAAPIPMILFCPECDFQHADADEWSTRSHRTHLCAACGAQWKPCARPTVGVQELAE